MTSPDLNNRDIARLYRSVRLIRRAEERVAEIYPSDKVKSPVHLSIGQEAISVGVCDALNPDDVVTGTYRGHALYLAKGGDLNAFVAELFGKVGGCARGKGGSMHLVDADNFMVGSSAVVATNIPIALGYALKLKREDKGRVVACFFGDGATEEGAFYESLNFAALKKLPVLFVCENNLLAIHSPLQNRWAERDVCRRVEGFGIPALSVADQNIFAIREAAGDALAHIRGGEGPRFMECMTYRWREHVGPNEDFNAGYRPRDELTPWQENDQMTRLASMLDAAERDAVDGAVEADIDAAIEFAETSPMPDIDELHAHVFAR